MVKIIKSGFYSTIQDLGRFDYQHYGVPVSGVMDQYSAKLANALLNNDENAAVLEITMTGPILQFTSETLICISGADMSPLVNNKRIKLNHVINLGKEDILSFGKLNFGFRCYLAVLGGFQTQKVMKSRSMYSNITTQRTIHDGDELSISTYNIKFKDLHAAVKVNADHFTSIELKAFKGPEYELLSKSQQKLLSSQEFTISKDYDRMAYQLVDKIPNQLDAIITSLVLPGTVQLTPSGHLIILTRDCQTTGGYPRVLQLEEYALDVLSQKFEGCKIRFKID